MLSRFGDIWIGCTHIYTSDWSGSCSEEGPLFGGVGAPAPPICDSLGRSDLGGVPCRERLEGKTSTPARTLPNSLPVVDADAPVRAPTPRRRSTSRPQTPTFVRGPWDSGDVPATAAESAEKERGPRSSRLQHARSAPATMVDFAFGRPRPWPRPCRLSDEAVAMAASAADKVVAKAASTRSWPRPWPRRTRPWPRSRSQRTRPWPRPHPRRTRLWPRPRPR